MLSSNRNADAEAASDRVNAAFARYDTAQLRAGTAGKDVERVAQAQTKRLKVDQITIRERTARQSAGIHPGETSEVRVLVEDMLATFDPACRNAEDEGR